MSGERLWERDHVEMILKVGEMKDKKNSDREKRIKSRKNV